MKGDSRRNASAQERRKSLKTPEAPQKASLMVFLEKEHRFTLSNVVWTKTVFTIMPTTTDIVVHVSTVLAITEYPVNCFMHVEISQK